MSYPDDTEPFGDPAHLGFERDLSELNLIVDRLVDRVVALEKMHEKSRGECVSVHSKTTSVPSGNPDM